MSSKIRVENLRKYSIGVVLQNGMSYNIRPHGHVMLDREDVEWIASIAPSLFDGEKQLRLVDRELSVDLGFGTEGGDSPMDDDAIRQKLSSRESLMKKWLNDVEEEYLLDAIYQVAISMDLSSGKLKILQEKMPNREFIITGA